MFNCRSRFRQSIREVKYRASRYLTLFDVSLKECSLRKQPSFFAPGRVAFRHSAGSEEGRLFSQARKSETHVANYCKYKLSRDREKNPGPPIYVDPNKTIAAPYSQGNELVFGQNCSYKFSLKR